jgi:hypothetical protein
MKLTEKNLIKIVGDLENIYFGRDLHKMLNYKTKRTKNELREKIMSKFGYRYRYTGINTGHWEKDV